MKIVDEGVLLSSFMDFMVPSGFARSALYYAPQFGHFYCDERYHIRRDYLDLYLLAFVRSGLLAVNTESGSGRVSAGNLLLLDCTKPHEYYCAEETDFLWFHFSGAGSRQYASFLLDRHDMIYTEENVSVLENDFETILSAAQRIPCNEHTISLRIHGILSALATIGEQGELFSGALKPALDYIHANYAAEQTVDDLAGLCGLSTSHFIRTFRKYTGSSPHDYLLAYRLKQAKQQILSTDATLEEIAESCGFGSASHFARAFRKSTGMTPSRFRQTRF